MDLNWLLSATAQSAAAIIAIIGGFIVSKLIEISSEKKEITLNLSEIRDELGLKNDIYYNTLNYLIEEYAKGFIYENIEDFVYRKPYEVVIQDKSLEYDKNTICKYWNKAIVVYNKLHEDLSNEIKLNKDNVPITRISEFNPFEYEMCDIIYSELEKQARKSYPTSPNSLFNFGNIEPALNLRAMTNTRDEERTLIITDNEIKTLDLKQRQLENRLASLKFPKEMKLGVFVFIYFTIVSIVFPLCMMPVSTNANLSKLLFIKWIDVVLFISGFILLLLFIISFIRTKNK